MSLLNDHQPNSLGHECVHVILNALKTLHVLHFLTYPATQDATYKYMPQHDSLTASKMFHPLQQQIAFFQRDEAISETSLHSSIHSPKVNKLQLPFCITTRQPMLIPQ
jgi:hypothetical protein